VGAFLGSKRGVLDDEAGPERYNIRERRKTMAGYLTTEPGAV
jgi:hypothetical protein